MTTTHDDVDSNIAIIGMGCRLPGAETPKQFWRNLREGVESIVDLADDDLLRNGASPGELANPAYVKRCGHVASADSFDASFFGYSAREAELMDPQHRLFLECSYEAMEDAGYDPLRYDGVVGVFAGSTMNTYLLMNLMGRPEVLDVLGDVQTMVGNDKEYLATRVSYKLALRGPSYAVQSACSSSLVAVHVACQSLLSGECDMAIAGGASVRSHGQGYLYVPGGTSSPDGHCRAFDARAAGSVVGSGAGAIVVKHLSDALSDGDHVYAVIRGSAVNNDGSSKVSFTAPSVDGQARAVETALAVARVTGDDITAIEAHGTATLLGDPIEVTALTRAFRRSTDRSQFCALGSAKTNIGHLDAAAGVAGLMKMVLSLQHRMIPPTLNFERPNPQLHLEQSPFFVVNELEPWECDGPRRGAVNSLGMGGTNAHVILEEAPPMAPRTHTKSWHVLPLSARNPAVLDVLSESMARHIGEHPDVDLGDIAYTLQVGRRRLNHRRIVLCRDREDAAIALATPGSARVRTTQDSRIDPPLVLLFPGQGTQRPGMAADLYKHERAFAAAFDECVDLVASHVDGDIRALLLQPGDDAAAAMLADTAMAQPALFVMETAIARVLRAWGVEPAVMIGHSIGELSAAAVAGVFRIEDAARLVAERGRLISDLPPGAMLAVSLAEEEVTARLPASLDLAAINGDAHTVVSGSAEEIARFEAELREQQVACRRLVVSHAFHSRAVEPAAARFASLVAEVDRRPPAVPFMSNVSGALITDAEAVNPEYWGRHIRQPVRFLDGVRSVAEPGSVFIEAGPGDVLSSLTRDALRPDSSSTHVTVLPMTSGRAPAGPSLLNAIGTLWLAGVSIRWQAVHDPDTPGRVSLPTYPFERKRYWVDVRHDRPARLETADERTGRCDDPAQWLHELSWRRLPPAARESSRQGSPRLVVLDDAGVGGALCDAWSGAVPVTDATSAAAEVARDDTVDRVVWLSIDQRPPVELATRFVQFIHELDRAAPGRSLTVDVVTAGVFDVLGGDAADPDQAAVHGVAVVAGQEYGHLDVRVTDVDRSEVETAPAEVGAALAAELAARAAPWRALRRGRVWGMDAARIPLEGDALAAPTVERGTYVVVGGLGAIGASVAHRLIVGRDATVVAIEHQQPVPGSPQAARLAELQAASPRFELMVADLAAVEGVGTLEQVVDLHSSVEGVFVASGPAADTAVRGLYEMRAADFAAQFKPREAVVRNIASFVDARRPSFCVVVGSLSWILGGVGSAAYAASNAWLAAFARSAPSGTTWLALDYEHWQMDGDPSAAGDRATYAIKPGEGLAVLDLALAAGLGGDVLVFSGDASMRIQRSARTALIAGAGEAGAEAGASASGPGEGFYPRPELQEPYVAPRSESERKIATIWSELIGVDPVGVLDNFFELGGQSLMALQLVAKLRDAFDVELPMAEMFDAPTVAQLVQLVEAVQRGEIVFDVERDGGDDDFGATDDVDELKRILADVESLDADEVAAALAAEIDGDGDGHG